MEKSNLQKISLAILTFNTCFNSLYCRPIAPTQTYTYVIKSEIDYQDPVHFKCTYKGCVIDLGDGMDFLPETDLVNNFEIIITPEHPLKVSNGTVSHLERIPDVECIWYDVSWAKEGTKTVWVIKQLVEDEMPPRIPDNAIIVCYPTEFIEKIEDKTPQESSSIIHLPTIVLKKNLTQEEKKKRDDELTRSILAQVDVNACLTPSKLVKKGNTIKSARIAPAA
jgi:hypothetical protein